MEGWTLIDKVKSNKTKEDEVSVGVFKRSWKRSPSYLYLKITLGKTIAELISLAKKDRVNIYFQGYSLLVQKSIIENRGHKVEHAGNTTSLSFSFRVPSELKLIQSPSDTLPFVLNSDKSITIKIDALRK